MPVINDLNIYHNLYRIFVSLVVPSFVIYMEVNQLHMVIGTGIVKFTEMFID